MRASTFKSRPRDEHALRMGIGAWCYPACEALGRCWLLVMVHSSELPKPNRLSRLVNRLKIETYSPTVAST